MMPDAQMLYRVIEATWPPARKFDVGPFTLRDGAGGGKRVSAATLNTDTQPRPEDLQEAEKRMTALGQSPLFMIREGDENFDSTLANAGYQIIDPVNLYSIKSAALTDVPIPRVTTFAVWEPLAIIRDLWAENGIGPERLDVMYRADGVKTALLGRIDDQPGAAAFVGIDSGIAMVHALEVRERHRRKGLASWMMRMAAFWACDNGANHLAVLCVKENVAANALYRGLGFAHVGSYHYRIKPD